MGNETLKVMITILLLMLLLLLGGLFYAGVYRMARVYNWNGRRYCYLGYVPIRRENGNFVVRLGERMVDLSRTTAYRICLSKAFCRKNRYCAFVVYAEGERDYLVIDGSALDFS